MHVISLNIRGFGGLAKQKTLRSLFRSLKPDMILVQETLCSTYPALWAFSKLMPGWEFCAINAPGLSRGLLTGWNPLSMRCKAFVTVAGILVHARFRDSSSTLSILNYYGPYRNREPFWEKVIEGGLLLLPNLVLAGDLNFTTDAVEI